VLVTSKALPFGQQSDGATASQFTSMVFGSSANMCRMILGTVTLSLLLSGCTGGKTTRRYAFEVGGRADAGREVAVQFRCGSCHTISKLHGADGVFGPPLDGVGRRTYVAGQIPNAPDNLTKWVLNPPAMKPGTAMPVLGLSEQQARDVAAYLYTLQ
jgi:cytochrome c2